MSYDIFFIGCGNMGSAILSSIYKQKKYKIGVVEKNTDTINRLKIEMPEVNFFSSISDQIEINNLVLAIKPQQYGEMIENYIDKLAVNSIISIMAGMKISDIERDFPAVAIARVMPNTPAMYFEGASGYCLNSVAEENDKFNKFVQDFLDSFGIWVKVSKESDIDSVTGLSGSGPAYVMNFIDAMIEAGIREGLSYDIAKELVIQTVKGSAVMAQKSDLSPSELKFKVMSPGGTTSAGVVEMESNGFRKSIYRAIHAATVKSKELGKK